MNGQRLRDLFFGLEIHPDEHDAQTLAGPLVLGERGAKVVFRDEARLNQALANFLTHAALTPRRPTDSDCRNAGL